MNAVVQPAPIAPPSSPIPFTLRIGAGLVGVLIAVLVAGFNDVVTSVELTDIQGVLGIGHDEGTWLIALYDAFQVSAMAFAPWCSVTFSLRRFTMAMAGLLGLLAAIAPFMPNLPSLYILRAIQGFAGGALPPMLMTVALRYLPPKIKIYGLGAYALTATFGPNVSTPIAALAFEYLGWHAVFWEAIPLCIISIALVAYGLPQDPLRLERFRQFDTRGLLLGFPAICMLVIGLIQGDRLDWFESPIICHLIIGGLFLFAMFLVNEWFHPLPFFRIQMLKSRDISFALIALAAVLVLAVANIRLPAGYLIELRGYRPLELVPLSLAIALPQLVALPLVAALCNIRRVDSRWVLAIGALFMAASAYGASFITADWYRGNFYALQMLEVIGQPMVVIPILMHATMKLGPTDGPFVSGMFNMTKGFASALAAGLISYLDTSREHTHSNVLLDQFGANQFVLSNLSDRSHELIELAQAVREQALVLTVADIDLVMAGIAIALVVLTIFMPTRVYPPASAQVSAAAR
jgi:DHA2 family multidrug resistance protein